MEKWGRDPQLFLNRALLGPGSLFLFCALSSVSSISKLVPRLRKFTHGLLGLTKQNKTLTLKASSFVFVLFILTHNQLVLFFISTRGIGMELRTREGRAGESTRSHYVALSVLGLLGRPPASAS